MEFTRKILLEHTVKYALIILITYILWTPIQHGLEAANESGKLEAIAVIMGIVSLCSLTGYYAFSYTVVGKDFAQRYFGYLCTFFLGVALLLSLLVIYFVSVISVPELKLVWMLILGCLYIGTILFDNLDLLRMGMDVAATNFFEKSSFAQSKDKFGHIVDFLKENYRLETSNTLIGKAIIMLGTENSDDKIISGGRWIVKNSDRPQHEIDNKVADIFLDCAKGDAHIKKILISLKNNQPKHIADTLIAELLEKMREKCKAH